LCTTLPQDNSLVTVDYGFFVRVEWVSTSDSFGRAHPIKVQDPILGAGSSWKIETILKTKDVYVFMRDGARWVHTSAHHSDVSHFAFIKNPADGDVEDSNDGYLDRTSGKQEVQEGWNLAFRIIVPNSSLQMNYVERSKLTKMLIIPPSVSQEVNCTIIDIFKVEVPLKYLGTARPKEKLKVHKTGEFSVVVSWTYACLSEDPQDVFQEIISEARNELKEQPEAGVVGRISVILKDEKLPNTKVQLKLAINEIILEA
jgi:hypothetical protein